MQRPIGLAAALAIWALVTACSPAATPATPAPTSAPAPTQAAAAGTPAPRVATSINDIVPLSPPQKIKLAFSNTNITGLPLFLATDREYFKRAGLEVEWYQVRGSAAAELPRLARGDIDVMIGLSPAPALFNQLLEGFDIKIVGSAGREKEGRLSPVWLTVIKDKASEIRTLQDLRGRHVEGGVAGSAVGITALEAIKAAGLTPGQNVNLTYRARATADFITFAQNKAADVIGMSEPTATTAEQQGLVVRWKSMAEIAPWYTPGLIGVSDRYLTNNRAAVVKFLEVYMLASREINATNGQWTPELINLATKWTEFPAKVITDQGLVPWFDPNADVSTESLERVQQIFLDDGQQRQRIDVNRLLDMRPRDEALRAIGQGR